MNRVIDSIHAFTEHEVAWALEMLFQTWNTNIVECRLHQ